MAIELPKKKSKTARTVEVDNELYGRAMALAKARGDTFRACVEYGLKKYIEEAEKHSQLELFNEESI